MEDVHGVILIVDDDTDTIELIEHQLKNRNWEILSASSADEGIQLLTDNDIQVVISDLHMPYVDGTHFLYEVRKKFPSTIRLVLSAKTDATEILEAVNAGHIYSFIQKPWKKESLCISIQNGLDVYKLSKERDELLIRSHNLNTQLVDLNKDLENKYQKKWETIEVLNSNISRFLLKKELSKQYLKDLLDVVLKAESYLVYRCKSEHKMSLLLESKDDLCEQYEIDHEYLHNFDDLEVEEVQDLLKLDFRPKAWKLEGLNRADDFLIISSEKWDNFDDYRLLIRLFLTKIP